MLFWGIALTLSALVALILIGALLRPTHQAQSDRALDLQIYRDQLSEIDSDLARGVLSADEAQRTRAEISRRLLDADRDMQGASQGSAERPGLNRTVAAMIAVAMLAGSTGLYWRLGADGAPDLPLKARLSDMAAQRPSQADAQAKVGNDTAMAEAAGQAYRDLVAQLRDTAGKRPDDLRGQELLAQHEARLGNYAAASEAMARVIALKGTGATAEDHTDLAELMIVAAGGYVSPEAEQALAKAVGIDPKNPRARYYSGLDLAQNGRADLAYQVWNRLLAEGPADAPWIAPIKAQIGDVARMAGVTEAMPGPTNEQVQDAGNMTPEDQQAMIRGMVARLSERLATEGGSAGPTQMAARGKILDVIKASGDVPLGSSGIQIRFETDLITEGMRPKRIIKRHEACRGQARLVRGAHPMRGPVSPAPLASNFARAPALVPHTLCSQNFMRVG